MVLQSFTYASVLSFVRRSCFNSFGYALSWFDFVVDAGCIGDDQNNKSSFQLYHFKLRFVLKLLCCG